MGKKKKTTRTIRLVIQIFFLLLIVLFSINHYREENGSFASLEELLKVKGIGKKKLERISPFCGTGGR